MQTAARHTTKGPSAQPHFGQPLTATAQLQQLVQIIVSSFGNSARPHAQTGHIQQDQTATAAVLLFCCCYL
jgi:hypothetical protein